MGKIVFNGKEITKPFVYNGKTVNSLAYNGTVVTLKSQAPLTNSFKGTFSSPTVEKQFMDIDDEVAPYTFITEPNITEIFLPHVTTVGMFAFRSSLLTKVDLPLVETIGNFVFNKAYPDYISMPKLKSLTNMNFDFSTGFLLNAAAHVTYLDLSSLETVPDYKFIDVVVNEATTTVKLPSKFNTEHWKNTLFGDYKWRNINFVWT